jgi:hypothetical protein
MKPKLIGMYKSIFDEKEIEMQVLDLVYTLSKERLYLTNSNTIFDLIMSSNKFYSKKYNLFCMSVKTGNTTITSLHSLDNLKFINIDKKGCKTIW